MFDAFGDSERWARTKADTKGLQEWKRNAVVSLVPALIQYLAQRSHPTDSALNDLVWAVVTFGLVFVCFPLIELGWNYIRSPNRILAEENARLRAELAEHQEQLEARRAKGKYHDITIGRHVLTIVNRTRDKDAPEFYAIVQVELTNRNEFVVDLNAELSVQFGFTRMAALCESWPMEDLIPELTRHHAAAIGPQLTGLVSIDGNRTRTGCLVFSLNPFILATIQAKAKLDSKDLEVLTLRVQDRNRPIEGRATLILQRNNIVPFLPDVVPPFIRIVKQKSPSLQPETQDAKDDE